MKSQQPETVESWALVKSVCDGYLLTRPHAAGSCRPVVPFVYSTETSLCQTVSREALVHWATGWKQAFWGKLSWRAMVEKTTVQIDDNSPWIVWCLIASLKHYCWSNASFSAFRLKFPHWIWNRNGYIYEIDVNVTMFLSIYSHKLKKEQRESGRCGGCYRH